MTTRVLQTIENWFSGASMSHAFRPQRTRTSRRLRMESLEPRWLLSASANPQTQLPTSLAIDFNQNEASGTAWVPSAAQMTQSPSSLTINFEQDARDSGYWVDGLVQLESLGSAGSSPVSLGPASFDPTGDIASIPILATLVTGNYQVVLAGSDFSYLLDPTIGNTSDLLWDPSQPLTLANFTVVQPGVQLASASDLGTIGPDVQSIAGSLDLSAQENVNLYKIALGPGHFWRLGVELNAFNISSNLRGALTLFDRQGNVLATANAGTGLWSDPVDPYLYAGLNPGVYYVGVSGAGDLGGQAGGYNPVAGTSGTTGQAQAGGPYDLQVVADPADSLTQVVGFSLQRADSLSATPTGISLSFSGPIDPKSLLSSSPIVVLDAAGNIWPTTLSSYGVNQLGFAFEQPLPPGQYRVVDRLPGGLTDLIGRAPVAPGQNPGVLANFTVARTGLPADCRGSRRSLA